MPRSPGARRQRVAAPVLAVALAALAACSSGGAQGDLTETGLEAVVTYEGLERTHVEGDVDYEQSPPVGGPHAPIWQDCGFYDAPVRDERAVHSLEHGAVWIAYDPQLDAEGLAAIEALAADEEYVLASPRDGLPSPVVASAWGLQLVLRGATDPRAAEFVSTHAQSAKAPEPSAPCSGGTSESGL